MLYSVFIVKYLVTFFYFELVTDENYKGGYVDTYIWSTVSKVMFNHMRNPYRDLSHTGYESSRSSPPREYVATEPVWVVLVTPRGIATIARIGESVYSNSQLLFLKYSPSPLPTANIELFHAIIY